MTNRQKPASLAFLLIGASLSIQVIAQPYYRWVDENGLVHYSQQQPIGIQGVEVAQIPRTHITAPYLDEPEETQQGLAEATETENASVFGRDQEMCQKVLQSLAVMQENEVVNMTMPDGSVVQIHGESRQSEIERLSAMQDYYC